MVPGKRGNFTSLIPFAFLSQVPLDFLGGAPGSSSTRSDIKNVVWGQTWVPSETPAPAFLQPTQPSGALDLHSGLRGVTGVKTHLSKGTSEKSTSLLHAPTGRCSSEPLCPQLRGRLIRGHIPLAAPPEHTTSHAGDHDKAKCTYIKQ